MITHWIWTQRPSFTTARGEVVYASSASFTLGILLSAALAKRETPLFTTETMWYRWVAHKMPGHE